MEFYDLAHVRESIRSYDPERPVPVNILERILNVGRMAPSAGNNQPWEFLVVQTPQMLEKIKSCYHREWYKDAPQILVISGRRDKAWVRSFDGYNSIETDLAIAMTFIILAAENEGVATCWIEAYDPALLHNALELADHQVVYGITPLGYPRADYKRKDVKTRKTLQEVVRYL